MVRAVLVGAIIFGAAHEAAPPEAAQWTASLSLTGSQADDESGSQSISASIERSAGAHWFRASIGGGASDVSLLMLATLEDQSILQGSVWWGTSIQGTDLTLSLGAGRQSLDGSGLGLVDAPQQLADVALDASGETTSVGVGATLSRRFGDAWGVTPSIGARFDQSETDVETRVTANPSISLSQNITAEGWTAFAGLGASGPVSDGIEVSLDVAGYSAEDGAAQTFSYGGGRTLARQDRGSAQWGEASARASFALSASASLDLTVGTLFGRETGESFAAVGFAWTL